jgi:outer membrane receptor protein involved in Fe transport
VVGHRAILVMAVAAAVAHAQQEPQRAGSVRGTVADKDLDAPLAQVAVSILETGQKVVSTDQGTFTFGQVAPGKYTLVFAKEGYVRQVKGDVIVGPGQLADVAVALAGDFTDMEEFVVQDVLQFDTGTEAGLLELRLESPALVDSVSTELISRAGASDAAGALRLVAGATVQNGKTPVIRGLPDRYVVSQMNGVRLPTASEDKRAVELDQFPAEVIGSIQVSKTFTPDQQGDASGGAVDVRLRGIPEEPFFFRVRTQTSHNTQVTGRGTFLSYDGGGVGYWGKDDGRRDPQLDRLGENWEGAVGPEVGAAPIDYRWSVASGGKFDLGRGVKIGAFANVFYERDSSHYTNGRDDQWIVEAPGRPMTPLVTGATPQFTNLFDVTQSKQSVQWGTLAIVGAESRNHALDVVHLQTRNAEDAATRAEDTRGKQYFFPGHDPANQNTPGHTGGELDLAPYQRLETLAYTERSTSTLQLHGRHAIAGSGLGAKDAPELDWRWSRSSADSRQPDRRQFGEYWLPGREIPQIGFFQPPRHLPRPPAENSFLGNFVRIFRETQEDSEQYAANLKLPFQLGRDAGYLKGGWFRDEIDRTFDQDTFSNFNDPGGTFEGPFEQPWSGTFPYEEHPITASSVDVDYTGRQNIDAFYVMADVPIAPMVKMIGGWRWESTRISIVNDPEDDVFWVPPRGFEGEGTLTQLRPGDADVGIEQDDALPSIGLVFTPLPWATLRTSYNETLARQTFRELTPILQQEYLGAPLFIGNPDLRISQVKNYDVRLDVTPAEGSLIAASWFEKTIRDPIEYVGDVVGLLSYTTPRNYPRGRMTGFEFELRQALGTLWEPLDGFAVGANATFLDARVTLSELEVDGFENAGVPFTERDMTNAPEHLYNAFVTYDLAATGTQCSVFWTEQGDTLVQGASTNGPTGTRFTPDVYARSFDTLNLNLTQQLGPWLRVTLGVRNLTNPDIEQVYRSDYIGDDVLRTSYRQGTEYVLGIGGEYRF